MLGMLFSMFVQSLFQFGEKEGKKRGNDRAITGRKIILTCPLTYKLSVVVYVGPYLHLCSFP